MKRMFESKLDKLRTDLMANVDNKVRALRDEISIDINRETNRTDQLLTTVQSIQTRLDSFEQDTSSKNSVPLLSNPLYQTQSRYHNYSKRFNSIIGALSETLSLTDNVPNRDILDKSIIQHGHEFIDFLNEAKFCVLNGRLAMNDNFTSISCKGKAVVDYICVPQDSFNDFRNF
ncbi:unnamed protein product [Mytilus coruscus]|uniref:Uncharacterized protein n=1 Tax=Mytilus coruscus TaxID=42192 RepID=A0A6J8BI12_MYTCO|nr:unnamed protein product [Mytilus coruscus]